MTGTNHRFYDFGEFRLDTKEKILLKKGEPVQITFRAYQVLNELVVNGGEIMTKDDLMEIVWGETAVEEGNLKNLVYSLRKTLGDDPGNSQFIQTLPKRGYKFVAEVTAVHAEGLVIERHRETDITIEEEIVTEPDPVVVTTTVPALPAAQRTRLRPWMAAIPVLLIAVIGGAYLFNFGGLSRSAFALENAKMTPLTFGANALLPVISPDGKFVAYIFSDEKGKSLYVRQFVTNNTLKLMDTSGSIWALTFSSDSNFVYLLVGNEAYPNGALYKISAIGGQSQKILDNLGSLAVSPTDGQLAFMREKALHTANADGQGERKLFGPMEKAGGGFQSFGWAADGKSIVASVVRFENNTAYWQIAEYSPDGSLVREIGPRFSKPVTIQTTPDGDGVIALELDNDAFTSKLTYLSRYGSADPRVLNKDTNYYNRVSLAADGKTMLAARLARPGQLSISPANDLSSARQVAAGYISNVRWTGGGSLTYDAIENGQTDIWTIDASGGARRQLTNNGKRNGTPTVPTDGRYIYYTSSTSGRSQLWRMNSDGSDPKQMTDLSFSVNAPQVSPDGESVYFAGFVEDNWHVFRVGKDGGEAQKLIENIAGMFAVSPDGKKIAHTATDSTTKKSLLLIRDIAGSEKDVSFETTQDIYWTLKWTPDSKALYYIGNENAATSCIYSQSVAGGAASTVKCLKNENFVNFDWSPDGQQFAFTTCRYILDAVTFTIL